MIKNILIGSLTAFTLLISGCGNGEGESKLQTQQMLDDGDFQGVINKLESSANSNSDYILLASAYMGKSGLTLTNLISTISDSSGSSSNSSGFAGFATALSSTTSPTAITDLKAAVGYYKKVANGACSATNTAITDSQRNICLYIGLASTGSAASTIELLAGDISTFGVQGEIDPKLTASTCAMKYAYDRDISSISNCSVAENGNVTFVGSGKSYTLLDVNITNATTSVVTGFEYLMTDSNTTALTKDYCTKESFATRQATQDAGYYACPVQETSGVDITSAGVLVDVLNNGLDAVGSAVNADIQGDLDQFKCEILSGTYSNSSCDVNTSVDINISDITTYLSNQNI